MELNKHVDHRWSARQELSLPVKLYTGGEPVGQGLTHDVGIGGMRIALNSMKADLERESQVSVSFTVTTNGNTSHHRLPATVIWSGDKDAGLMFTDFNVDTVHTLRDILYPQ